jgi:glycosyltransferase involved in cell wall biosynthesis
MTRPDISLIVNTFQKPRHLALVLKSIALQEGIDGRFEVVVADDGSDATTVEIISDFARQAPFPVAFTTEPHDGFRLARVRNRGAALAAGDTLLFLDGDSVLPPDHVAAHLGARRPGLAMLGDVVRLPEATSRALVPSDLATTDLRRLAPAAELRRMSRRHRKSVFQNWLRHPSKPRLAGGNFAVWRDDYSRVNGSDERFLGWGQEDDDLGLRLRGAGVRLSSIIDRTFTYHVWHPSDPSATPRWRDGVNVRYFLRRGRLSRCRRGICRSISPRRTRPLSASSRRSLRRTGRRRRSRFRRGTCRCTSASQTMRPIPASRSRCSLRIPERRRRRFLRRTTRCI